MLKQIILVFATLAISTVAFAQPQNFYQIGFAANLNIGDSEFNISNDGTNGGFYPNTLGAGNICVNVYTFDPSEEMVSCCACLVTPNALVSLSAKNDLINNVLTPAIPTSIVIKLVASTPGTATGGVFTVCNPTIVPAIGADEDGTLAWGTTLEPAATPGTYGPVNVPFINGTNPNNSELDALANVYALVQAEGTGYGVCKSCALGALSGTKQ
ncbi:MAG: hypothetical protein ABSB35_17130 [Bryobacteraceae bacterium]|jgi:hypothetical protein